MHAERLLPSFLEITAYSDFDPVPDRRPLWRDDWLKENLLRGLQNRRYPAARTDSRVLLHLFGRPLESLPEETYNILWHHSHPDWLTPEILSRYHKIYCASRPFVSRIRAMGFEAEWLMVPTHVRPIRSPKVCDIVFVGNARRDGTQRAVEWLAKSRYQVRVWGAGWKGRLPDSWLAGTYYENGDLGRLYSAAKIVVNDHHEDMRREGFVNQRTLDALAGGSLVVSDRVTGMEDVFEDTVPTFTSSDELIALVDQYLHDDAARQRLVKRGQRIAMEFTYESAIAALFGNGDETIAWGPRERSRGE